MGRYFQEEIETASREQIEQWQNEGLVSVVKRVYENVPYYRDKMDEAGVTPEDIKSIADLPKLPFLTKDDLRDAYPYGLLAIPLKDCVRIQSTSGTTGRRNHLGTLFAVLPNDFNYLIYLIIRHTDQECGVSGQQETAGRGQLGHGKSGLGQAGGNFGAILVGYDRKNQFHTCALPKI